MELMIFPLHLVPSDAKTKVNRGNGKTKKSGKILLLLLFSFFSLPKTSLKLGEGIWREWCLPCSPPFGARVFDR
jgi:hypothetical protein